jgi:Asp-tRNA(Asn)/Glu-tRNA(Gln) amidotransferase A subunit family amidase
LRRPVFGVPDGPYLAQAGPEGQAHFQRAAQRLSAAGYDVRHVSALPDFDLIRARHNLIVAAEAARVHAGWYSRYRERYHAKTAELIERGQTVTPEALAQALDGRAALRDELTRLMDAHGLDVWVAPSAPGPAPLGLESTGDPVMNLPWTYSGLPAIGLPAGVASNGLPLGTQLVGRWQSDESLLAWAAQVARVVI